MRRRALLETFAASAAAAVVALSLIAPRVDAAAGVGGWRRNGNAARTTTATTDDASSSRRELPLRPFSRSARADASAAFGSVLVPPSLRRGAPRRRAAASFRTRRTAVGSPDGDGKKLANDDDGTVVEPLESRSLSPHFPSRLEYSLPNHHPPGGNVDRWTDLRPGRRIIGIGDVHGDLDALRSFLIAARVVDPACSSWPANPIWTGGDAIVVQTGDVLDRGDDELACFRILTSLARQAEEAGGALIILYGNHEALNAAGLFQYANRRGNEEMEGIVGDAIDDGLGSKRWRLQFAGNEPSRWAAFEPGGILAEPLLANMKVATVIGRTCFVHAGLTARHLREYGGIEGMNDAVREWIIKAHHGENNNVGQYDSIEQIASSASYRSRIATYQMPDCLGGGVGGHSPVWMREYHAPNDKEPKCPSAQTLIDEALNELGGDVKRMVMGHTPQFRINCALDGKAWRIDVGASRGVMGGTPEVLEIVHGGEDEEDQLTILTANGGRVDGSERQVVPALF